MAAFSSRGPTWDGRYKPDLVAPGTFINSTLSRLAPLSNFDGWLGDNIHITITNVSCCSGRIYPHFGFIPVQPNPMPTLTPTPTPISANPLDTVIIPILADNPTTCTNISFDIIFDTNKLQFINITKGADIKNWEYFSAVPIEKGLHIEAAAGNSGLHVIGDKKEICKVSFKILANYALNSGTSMASPIACGIGALIREYLNLSGVANPSSALIKALLLNGCDDMYPGQYNDVDKREIPTPAPNFVEGWDRINPENSLPDPNRKVLFDVRSVWLSTGQTAVYEFFVADNSIPLKAKLVWTDFPASPAANFALVNDLDLELITPSGNTIRPLNPRQKTAYFRRDNSSA